MLMQLLLPSDEWYYTNHTTKYARYVKYHAARILVYLGHLNKLGGRVDLFDPKIVVELVVVVRVVVYLQQQYKSGSSILIKIIVFVVIEVVVVVVVDLAEKNMSPLSVSPSRVITTSRPRLFTPLELNIHPRSNTISDHKTVCATQSDSIRGSKPRLFRWQSKKLLSKSQVSVSATNLTRENSLKLKIEENEAETGSSRDVDIIAFQRELINLPTFVMDLPLDVSPVFSRSSSVPENLAGRLNPTLGSLCQLSAHSSRKRLSKSGCGSDQAVSTLVHAGSAVAITMTDPNQNDSVFFLASDGSTTDSIANIIVHFDPPQSPIISSASGSGSPQTFEFPGLPFGNNLLQPGSANNNLLATTSAGMKGLPDDMSAIHIITRTLPELSPDISDAKTSSSTGRPDALRISPAASPVAEMPVAHQGVLKVIETWIAVCPSDLEG
ncbi:hypothetical protein DPMN_165017 [Dreissena polymorpha]|uniref:Uncharacterized protein n=1 Tax=Dreissena polymorpha TaxID=45954 RepID=A0A9D4EZT5_DREPO|nr:hypothetical protein DPMN_165017 [Dreissena polymorpha]